MNGRRSERLILTPEHVPIRLLPAGLSSRFLALPLGPAWTRLRVLSKHSEVPAE